MTQNEPASGASRGQVPSNPVVIEDYNPHWPQKFESLRSRLANLLAGLAITIDHVGSTTVPGLAAKPIIDLDALLKSAGDLPSVIAALASIGYQHRGDLGVPRREAFRTPPGDFPQHLYVCTDDTEYRRHIAFRDHLRSHRRMLILTLSSKRTLAVKSCDNREAYTNAKKEFVECILQKSATGKSLSKLAVSSVADNA